MEALIHFSSKNEISVFISQYEGPSSLMLGPRNDWAVDVNNSSEWRY